MRSIKKLLLSTVVGSMLTIGFAQANSDLVKQGEKVFNTKNLGNCLACHAVSGKSIDGPGSMGPNLVGLKYWDEQTLYDTVYDIYSARQIENTSMPAFGKSGWLSDNQIKAVVAYLKTIE